MFISSSPESADLSLARHANLETVPVIVRNVADEQEMLILALVENVDRSEMTPVEEGDGYLALRTQGMSNAEIARKVGVTDVRVGTASSVQNYLKRRGT